LPPTTRHADAILTITDDRWELLQPLLPVPQRAATAPRAASARTTAPGLNGILDVLRSGIAWEDQRRSWATARA
jgi:transposase